MRTLFRLVVVLSMTVLIPLTGKAQNSSSSEQDLDLDQLKAPSTPSAAIIGTQINEIAKPQNIRALKAEILNNYFDEEDNFQLPNNYAFEMNLYKLIDNTTPNLAQYLDTSCFKGMANRVWRNTAVSVATTNEFTILDTVKTDATGLGLRMMLFNGKPSDEIKKAFIDAYNKQLYTNINEGRLILLSGKYRNNDYTLAEAARKIIEDFKNVPNEDLFSDGQLKEFSTDEINQKRAEQIDIISKALSTIQSDSSAISITDQIVDALDATREKNASHFQKQLKTLSTERIGFKMELNGALGLNFPTNEFNFSYIPRYGIWLNSSYTMPEFKNSKTSMDVIFLTRYIGNNTHFIEKYRPVDTTFIEKNMFDLGGRLVLNGDKMSLEFEYIYRINGLNDGTDNNSRKYVLNFNYELSDKIILSYNLGKNFDNPISGVGTGLNTSNLINGLTLNVGFGSYKINQMVDKILEEAK